MIQLLLWIQDPVILRLVFQLILFQDNHFLQWWEEPCLDMEKPLVKYKYNSGNVELKDIMIGHEAAQYRSFLELSHPVSEGNI